MKLIATGVLALGVLASTIQPGKDAASVAADKGARWLVSVQGYNGGWGQDGGETSFVRTAERLESNGNDVANTALATQALLKLGHTPTRGEYQATVRRGVDFVVRSVEESPADGLAVTRVTGSQIQRKLGPYIDTFLTSMLLAEVDGNMGDAASNQRVRAALEKTVAKIQKHQQTDGSWNISGGWAPILGTSMASRGLYAARQKGVPVEQSVMAKVDDYTKRNAAAIADARPVAGGVRGGVAGGAGSAVMAPAAGVPLYEAAQRLEQLSRTSADREKNAREIRAVTKDLDSAQFVRGFGSMGGEEFFSYLNIGDGLKRAGGQEWTNWNGRIKTQLVDLQNQDGTWAGHHCITGRVAVTSAAILTLVSDREPAAQAAGKAQPTSFRPKR